MGRAFRVIKRTSHLTVAVEERAERKALAAPPPRRGAKPRARAGASSGKGAGAQKAGTRKKAPRTKAAEE
jgi:hypothetical protein